MIWLFAIVVLAVMMALVAIIVELLIPRAVIALGGVDSWWSPLRTLPPPGEMYILVRGSKTGPFYGLLESVLDHEYDAESHEFRVSPERLERMTGYLESLGVAWVGFFRYLLYREVKHDKWEQKPNSTEFGIISKIRPGPSIFFRYNMATEIRAAETIGNFPVNAVIVFTAQVVNPVKAFFFAGGWEAQTTAAVQGRFRRYVSDKRVEDLRQEQQARTSALVTTEIKSLSLAGPDGMAETGLRYLFGIEIIDARFVEFDLVSGDKDEAMLNAIRAVGIAEREAEAAAKRGDGERQERQNRAAGVRAEVEAWGAHPVGGQVAMAEAIKEAKPNVLGGGVIASVEAARRT